jgi:eukaryotic-like serine/threonine-protein kinase
MSPERWQQIQAVLVAVLERSPGEREAYLDEAAAGDPELRATVHKLLASDQQAEARDFLGTPPVDVKAHLPPTEPEDAFRDKRVGRYEIKKCIGSGGMGTVYLAVRVEDFRQQVAIKLVKRGMDTDEIIRRFRTERQVLASLRHDNIAKLLDGGTSGDGLPYFVMEYIEGTPIDQYCDRHKLPTARRLKLFRTVCSAVHYAHQNLVIHRDLKPLNILVTADGVPKLLDFGIAKLTNPELSSQLIDPTQTQCRRLTPEFASPEQIRGEIITTASDVYSLGVVLYQLLTGHRPYQLTSLPQPEVERIVCEREPERPSLVIRRSVELRQPDGKTFMLTPETVGATRDGHPDTLSRVLKGDLDNILLRSLKKLPEERYNSVEQFAEDIERYLSGLPVRARKDTFLYRARKFVKRNKLAVTMAVLVALSLLGGVVGTTVALLQAREAMQLARKEQERAEANLRETYEVVDYLVSVSDDNLLNMPGSQQLRLEVLQRALGYYKSFLATHGKDPQFRAEVAAANFRMAQINVDNGRWQDAFGPFRDGLAILEPLVRDNADAAQFKGFLVGIYKGRLREPDSAQLQDVPVAMALLQLERARAIWETLAQHNPRAPGFQNDLAGIHNAMGLLQRVDKKYDKALKSFGKARDIWKALVTADPGNGNFLSDLATAHGNIADVYSSGLKQPDKALDDAREDCRIIDKLVLDHPGVYSFKSDQAFSFRALGSLLKDLGRRSEALASYRKAHDIWKELLRDFPTAYIYQRSIAEVDVDLAGLDQSKRNSILYGAACAYARCIDLIALNKRSGQLTPQETATQEKHGARAVELLRKIYEDGYFKDPAQAEDLGHNKELDRLKVRADFQRLLADLKQEGGR